MKNANQCCADYRKTTLDDGTTVETHTFRCSGIDRTEADRQAELKYGPRFGTPEAEKWQRAQNVSCSDRCVICEHDAGDHEDMDHEFTNRALAIREASTN